MQSRPAMRTFTRLLFVALLSTAAYAQEPTQSQDTQQPSDTTNATDTNQPNAKADTTKTAGTKGAQKEKLTQDTLQTLGHYHHVNQMEIDLGKAAQKRGGSQAVKQYGEMLVTDHQANDKKIKSLAQMHGQRVPMAKPKTDMEKQEMAQAKQHASALKKLKGADFDREYLRMMVEDHDKELAKIDTNIEQAQNDQVADLLRDTKPVLQRHADQARELQKNSAQAMNNTPPPAKSARK